MSAIYDEAKLNRAKSLCKKAEALFRSEIMSREPDDSVAAVFLAKAITEKANSLWVSDHEECLVALGEYAITLLRLLPCPENHNTLHKLGYLKPSASFAKTKQELWKTILIGFHAGKTERDILVLGQALMQMSLFEEERKLFADFFREYYKEHNDSVWFRNNIAILLPHCKPWCKSISFRFMFDFMLRHPNESYLHELIRFK